MAKQSKAECPWERQKGESAQAFEAFSLYCRMGADRSIRAVAQELDKSRTLIGRWSSTWKWQSRSREYDNELKRIELETAQKEQKAMRKRLIQTAMLMQKKAVKALDTLDPEKLSPQDIMKFILEGAKLEDANRSADTQEIAGDTGNGGQGSSLADAVISAYQKRMENGDD